jgi:riboflavin kinase/FMN adenylyltransferase
VETSNPQISPAISTTLLAIPRMPRQGHAQQQTALSIGNFDGVHLGHQSMLQRLREAATAEQLQSAVLTFSPHPREYFAEIARRPELTPTHITGLRDKVQTILGCGIDRVWVARFNRHLAEMSALAFIKDLLIAKLNVRWLLVGEDFRFGAKRAGDIALLRQVGAARGVSVQTHADIVDGRGHRISSSEVRAALALGDLIRARALLGRHFALTGHVIHGQKLGRTLGFPTMNMRVTDRCAARSGIYVVAVHGLGDKPLPGIASLGVRPTVLDNGQILLETHVLDAQIDAYGKLVRVEFLQHVRDEEKFPDLTTLTAAMNADRQHARAYFALHGL